MFSIIIPLYNKEKQIAETLNSVLQQTFTDFEIVIVNDGSKDKSGEVVKSFNDHRIRLINQENAGVSAARNRGIKEAKNDWIAFLDADDLWREDKLEIYAAAIHKYVDIQWLMSGFQTIKSDVKKNFVYKRESMFLNEPLDDLIAGLAIHTSTVVVKREYFLKDQRLYFKVGINNSEDREVWYRLMFRFSKLFYIHDILSYYNLDADENSLTKNVNKKSHFLGLKTRLEDDFDDCTILSEERRNKIEIFIEKFNRKALWYQWKNSSLVNENKEYLSDKDRFIMDMFGSFPVSFKLLILKIFL